MQPRLALVGVALLAACVGGDGAIAPSDNRVTSIVVSASSASVNVGDHLTATARAVNAAGKTVDNVMFSWSSSDPTVASVSGSGTITGLSQGTADIIASAVGVAGQMTLSVIEDYCAHPLSLQVGEVRVLGGPSAVSCITLAPSQPASDYLFIAANASTTQDDVASYVVSASVGGTSVGSASIVPFAQAVGPQPGRVQEAFEGRLRALQIRAFGGRQPADLQRSSGRAMANLSVSAAANVAVGDTIGLRVPNGNGTDLCADYTTVRGVVRALGNRAQIVEDIAAPSGGFTAADYQALAAEFDGLTFPTDSSWFGPPSDINGDGHITILYTPEINKLTPPGSQGFVAGFFWGGDLLPRSIPSQRYTCPASNEQEIFYLLAPDPTGSINGNARSTVTVRQGTRGTIAHEFQHMINQGIRQANGAADETSWLNEALSHFAEEAVGRAARSFSDVQRLSYGDVTADAADYDAFFRQNLARLRLWMQRPDTASAVSARAAFDLAPRGAAWALVRFTADRYASADPRAFFRHLVAGPETDVTNLVTRAGAPFDDILSGFLIANFASGLNVPGLDPRYMFQSWDMRDAMSGANGGMFPLLVTPLPAQIATKSLAGSGNYFRLTLPANSPAATFHMQGSVSGGPVPFITARVYVVRLG